MYENDKLSSSQRNYRASGKKLKPRSSFDAESLRWANAHSMRELRKMNIEELRATLPQCPDDRPAYVRRMEKTKEALSTRKRKRVERVVWGPSTAPIVGAAMGRYARALDDAECAERMMEADARLLRYAI
jgi:hypothetical protein